jgi:hypothetical protein
MYGLISSFARHYCDIFFIYLWEKINISNDSLSVNPKKCKILSIGYTSCGTCYHDCTFVFGDLLRLSLR